MHKLLGLFLLFLSFLSCEDEPKKKEIPFVSGEEYNQMMILSHQEYLKKERYKINSFVDSTQIDFQKTGTGLRYYIYQKSNGDSIKSKEIAFITYALTSLEGDSLYSSPKGKLQEFMVDYDNVESGLHEGIKKMKVGEKALFILPAHLAHGVSGDNAAIPSQSTLLYNVHLVGKQ